MPPAHPDRLVSSSVNGDRGPVQPYGRWRNRPVSRPGHGGVQPHAAVDAAAGAGYLLSEGATPWEAARVADGGRLR